MALPRFEIVQGDEHLTSASGLALIERLLALARAKQMQPPNDTRPLRLHLDAGFDNQENLVVYAEAQTHFIFVRNRWWESAEQWLEIAKANAIGTSPRSGKTIWIGETTRQISSVSRRIVFQVIERTSKPTPDGYR